MNKVGRTEAELAIIQHDEQEGYLLGYGMWDTMLTRYLTAHPGKLLNLEVAKEVAWEYDLNWNDLKTHFSTTRNSIARRFTAGKTPEESWHEPETQELQDHVRPVQEKRGKLVSHYSLNDAKRFSKEYPGEWFEDVIGFTLDSQSVIRAAQRVTTLINTPDPNGTFEAEINPDKANSYRFRFVKKES